MNRVSLIGNAGSGKSTLARQLGEITGLPIIHSDVIYHSTNWPKNETEKIAKWQSVWTPLIAKKSWIIDGNNNRVLPDILKKADTIIFLDYPRYVLYYRLVKRRFKYNQAKRPDMPEQWKEKIDLGFWKLVWKFKKESRPEFLKAIDQYAGNASVLIFKSPKQLKNYLTTLSKEAN